MRKTPSRLTYTQKKQLEQTLGMHLKLVDEGKKLYNYSIGMDDHGIVDLVRPYMPGITVHHVRGMRCEVFGQLASRTGGGNSTKRIDALEARIARLESKLTEELSFVFPALGE